MTDFRCWGCEWRTFYFERRCYVCGFDHWNWTHNGPAGDWAKGLIAAVGGDAG